MPFYSKCRKCGAEYATGALINGLCHLCFKSNDKPINSPTAKDVAELFMSPDEWWDERDRRESMSDGHHDTHGNN